MPCEDVRKARSSQRGEWGAGVRDEAAGTQVPRGLAGQGEDFGFSSG